REIAVQLQQPTQQVILDLRRITEIDSAGAEILRQIDADLTAQGASLALCVMQPSEPAAILADSGVLDAVTPDKVFGHVDRALEWAEERLLQTGAGAGASDTEAPLERAGVFSGLTSDEVTATKRHLRRTESKKGETVFGEGEQAKELFIITSGTASAYLRQTSGADIRLATFAPGTIFGELAILDPGPRSASVIADDRLVCYAFSDESFRLLSRESPAVAIKLLANLSRELSRRLRQANRTIQQLEE
ncbi:MAG: cyclic nucleotide-binding domain-containing protein, partial [Betaproteobacteria bacterium]